MLKAPHITALCLLFASASAASAQSIGPREEPANTRDVRVQFTSRTVAADPVRPTRPEAGLFDGANPGVGISRNTYRAEDGSSAVRRGLIGSLPLTPGVSAGVGLFSVTHEDQKEPEFRRSWTAKNVSPRDRRVAAVGLNVRF